MTSTLYKLAQDITGATGDVLPFSSDMVIANDITVQVPYEGSYYKALFTVIPATGNISVTQVAYNENPELESQANIEIFLDTKFSKKVKAGSTLVMSKYRTSIDPDATYTIHFYMIP